MKAIIKAITVVLILLSMQGIAQALSTEEMINAMNTPENVLLVSNTLNNANFLSEILSPVAVNTFITNNAYFILVGENSYYFVKYIGITQCIANCDSTMRIRVKTTSVEFVYVNQAFIIGILEKGTLDFWTKLDLFAKATIFYASR